MGKKSSLKELLAFLESEGLSPSRVLSQNFLVDANILDKIIALAAIEPGDRVIEIGPGPGALTDALLEAGAEVIAIEKDPQFAQILQRRNDEKLKVFEADFLTFDLALHFTEGPLKVVANIPYHLTTPIFNKILPLYPFVKSCTLMIQKEVAEKLKSGPGSKSYGLLSLLRELTSNLKGSFTVSHNCFYPKPKIDSAVVSLELKPLPEGIALEPFLAFLTQAFSQRRKKVSSLLDSYMPKGEIEARLRDPNARAENLTLADFIALYTQVISKTGF